MQERERVQQRESLERAAVESLKPGSDTRVRLVIDTNIFLAAARDVERLWDELERKHCRTAKVFVLQVVIEEIDRLGHPGLADTSPKSVRARSVIRYLKRKFTTGAAATTNSFWELQEREIDEQYKRKVALTAAGKRSCDMRIFYFLRDCHRQRPGCVLLVTNDQLLALEAGSAGIETLSLRDLLDARWRSEGMLGRSGDSMSSLPARTGARTGEFVHDGRRRGGKNVVEWVLIVLLVLCVTVSLSLMLARVCSFVLAGVIRHGPRMLPYVSCVAAVAAILACGLARCGKKKGELCGSRMLSIN